MIPVLALLALAASDVHDPAPPEPAPFVPSAERFADAAACGARLLALVREARGQDYAAVEGPYAIAEGDIRIHMVRAEEGGHRITEQRCLGPALASRSWRHAMEEADEPFTIESAARKAEWLKKDAADPR